MSTQGNRLAGTARLLVESDGSTGSLLEALTGASLAARVDVQGDIPASRLPEMIRASLGLPGEATALERRSCLVTPELEVMSINRVVADKSFQRRLGEFDTFSPLASQLRDRRVPFHREQLSHGFTRWRDSGREHWVDCLYADYVLTTDTGGRAYVHAHFNPGIIPVSEAGPKLLAVPQSKGHVP